MSNFERMTPAERVKKVHIDLMKHKEFALLSGVALVGKVSIDPKCPTAWTNGRDVTYGEKFVMAMNIKQLRYLVAHENLHKALRHCTEYVEMSRKYPDQFAAAVDFCVNDQIETMDPNFEFVERPTAVPPLVDKKFHNWSMLRILKFLVQNSKGGGKGKGKGEGQGGGNGGFDEHEVQEGEEGQLTAEELREAAKQIDDAVRQGKIVQQKLAGNEAGGHNLDVAIQNRDTRWREHLREFVSMICKGDDMSRFVPPNKRMLASGFIMPSHFSESTGELHIYCDTSGSMTGVYPIVFGEVVQIVRDVNPEKVRIIWWDTAVAGEQVFEPKDYGAIAQALQPKGGGGTTPEVVRKYVDKKGYKAKCGVFLSDGDFFTSDVSMPWPVLWGIIGNDNFTPAQGKVVNINIDNF